MNRHIASMLALMFLVLSGCEANTTAPAGDGDALQLDGSVAARGGSQHGKKPKKDEPAPDPEPEPTPDYAWYELAVPDDGDPLWRFGLSEDLVLLRTDPTVTSWGSDYWGAWAEPFPLVDGSATYVSGLTRVTYTFTPYRDGFDVTRILVVQPYLGGEPTTTTTHVGTFAPSS